MALNAFFTGTHVLDGYNCNYHYAMICQLKMTSKRQTYSKITNGVWFLLAILYTSSDFVLNGRTLLRCFFEANRRSDRDSSDGHLSQENGIQIKTEQNDRASLSEKDQLYNSLLNTQMLATRERVFELNFANSLTLKLPLVSYFRNSTQPIYI